MHWIKKIFLLFVFLAVCIAATGYYIYGKLYSPSQSAVELSIEPGTSLKGISRALEAHGVIPDAFVFEAAARLTGEGSRFKAGDYDSPAGTTAMKAMSLLKEGKVKLTPLTIPEGYNLNMIGAMLVEKKLVASIESWRMLVRDPDLIASLGIEAATLEGYLFPDTYML